jgi:hypothetical protein
MTSELMGPRLKHTLNVVERQNEVKAKLKRTLRRLDEGNNLIIKHSM